MGAHTFNKGVSLWKNARRSCVLETCWKFLEVHHRGMCIYVSLHLGGFTRHVYMYTRA